MGAFLACGGLLCILLSLSLFKVGPGGVFSPTVGEPSPQEPQTISFGVHFLNTGQKVRSGLPHWIFHVSQHMASLDDMTGKEEASLVPDWSFICRGFPYIGGFQHWNPAAILPVGLPVSHMLKYSLNSGRGSILTTPHPWHFLKELINKLGHTRMRVACKTVYLRAIRWRDTDFSLPTWATQTLTWSYVEPGFPGPTWGTH